MDTSGVGATGSSGSLAQTIAGNQTLGQQEFLKLLITQLTNQNPLDPQDDKQFLAQMAQFSTVEGVNNMSSSMSQFQGAAMIGRTVNANVVDDTGIMHAVTGVVSAVQFKTDGVHLTVGDKDVLLSQVEKVSA